MHDIFLFRVLIEKDLTFSMKLNWSRSAHERWRKKIRLFLFCHGCSSSSPGDTCSLELNAALMQSIFASFVVSFRFFQFITTHKSVCMYVCVVSWNPLAISRLCNAVIMSTEHALKYQIEVGYFFTYPTSLAHRRTQQLLYTVVLLQPFIMIYDEPSQKRHRFFLVLRARPFATHHSGSVPYNKK